MSEAQAGQPESQKTVVAFIAGLLIGGLLVWVFSPSMSHDSKQEHDGDKERMEESTEAPEAANGDLVPSVEGEETTREMKTGDGSVSVANQAASAAVAISDITYPVAEGWVGVRDYNNGEMGFILGVVRFSESQGLNPESIILQRPTIAGNEYAVVFYNDNGDRQFDPRSDTMVDGVMSTFTAE